MKYTFLLMLWLIVSCTGQGGAELKQNVSSNDQKIVINNGRVGFFQPIQLDSRALQLGNQSVLLWSSAQQIKEQLKLMQGYPKHELWIDLTVLLTKSKASEQISAKTKLDEQTEYEKKQAPTEPSKLVAIKEGLALEQALEELTEVLKMYPNTVYGVFLIDEPLINGVSGQQINQLNKQVKQALNKANQTLIKTGIVFAHAMYEPVFNQEVEYQSGGYAKVIDDQIALGDKTLIDKRLVSYDRAGNMGQLDAWPDVDVIAFDWYASSLLLDQTQVNFPDLLAKKAKQLGLSSCAGLEGKSIAELKNKVIFFNQSTQDSKAILDQLFECRHKVALRIIEQNKKINQGVMIWVSTSADSLFNQLNFAQTQEQIVEEFKRALLFYKTNQATITHGVMGFTWSNAFDESINVKVNGAENFPQLQQLYVLEEK